MSRHMGKETLEVRDQIQKGGSQPRLLDQPAEVMVWNALSKVEQELHHDDSLEKP